MANMGFPTIPFAQDGDLMRGESDGLISPHVTAPLPYRFFGLSLHHALSSLSAYQIDKSCITKQLMLALLIIIPCRRPFTLSSCFDCQ
jgi:hypothetical protein